MNDLFESAKNAVKAVRATRGIEASDKEAERQHWLLHASYRECDTRVAQRCVNRALHRLARWQERRLRARQRKQKVVPAEEYACASQTVATGQSV